MSLSCKDGVHTNHGERFAADCVPLLAACPSVVAIGVNCTAPQHLRQLLGGAREALRVASETKPKGLSLYKEHQQPVLMCYPNSGEGWDCEARAWRPGGEGATPEGFASTAKEWVAAGARIVGGCCRTTPEHISALRRMLVD
jgi:homocysteine S-methyltransferase